MKQKYVIFYIPWRSPVFHKPCFYFIFWQIGHSRITLWRIQVPKTSLIFSGSGSGILKYCHIQKVYNTPVSDAWRAPFIKELTYLRDGYASIDLSKTELDTIIDHVCRSWFLNFNLYLCDFIYLYLCIYMSLYNVPSRLQPGFEPVTSGLQVLHTTECATKPSTIFDHISSI